MTAVEVRVDDRVILISAVAACAGYLLLQWHRSQFVLRSAEPAQQDRSHQHVAAAADPTDTEAAWVSRLLEQHFSRSPADDALADLPLMEVLQARLQCFCAYTSGCTL
jgi:Flp pilus assembly protein CpaB